MQYVCNYVNMKCIRVKSSARTIRVARVRLLLSVKNVNPRL